MVTNIFGAEIIIYMQGFILALVVTILAMWLLRQPALHYHHVDISGGHKCHEGEVPLIGGLSMFIGFICASLYDEYMLNGNEIVTSAPLYSGAFLLLMAGTVDDRRHLPVRVRLLIQVVAVLFMIFWGGLGLQELGSMFYGETLQLSGMLMVTVTVFAGVGGINAFNMQDGADGLAGSLALVTLASLVVLSGYARDYVAMQPMLIMIGALLAFLLFNARLPWRKCASVFMGDAGSLFIGFLLVWYMTALSQGDQRIMTPVTALWIFAMPLFDAVYTILRRVLSGRAPFAPDRGHLHHLLLARGIGTGQAVALIAVLAAGMAGLGIAGYIFDTPEWGMFYGFLLLFALYSLLVTLLWRRTAGTQGIFQAP